MPNKNEINYEVRVLDNCNNVVIGFYVCEVKNKKEALDKVFEHIPDDSWRRIKILKVRHDYKNGFYCVASNKGG